jgi:hypothetical protein
MIQKGTLWKIARARIEDSRALLERGRCDGAVYLCGYAVELALKACICRHLGRKDFPATKTEEKAYGVDVFKHDFDDLLVLTGQEVKIRGAYLAEWLTLKGWGPHMRYRAIGSVTYPEALNMVNMAETLVKALWRK